MALDLEAVRARCDAATEGPWDSTDGTCVTAEAFYEDGGETIDLFLAKHALPEDVAFVACARMDVPALVAEVERLRALEQTVTVMVEDGHPFGSPAADEWFAILVRRLAADSHDVPAETVDGTADELGRLRAAVAIHAQSRAATPTGLRVTCVHCGYAWPCPTVTTVHGGQS